MKTIEQIHKDLDELISNPFTETSEDKFWKIVDAWKAYDNVDKELERTVIEDRIDLANRYRIRARI